MADSGGALPGLRPTVLHLLTDAVARAPETEALVCGEVRVSYDRLALAVAGFAGELRALGSAGERVALLCGNSVEAVVATLAIQAAGAVFCPMNPAYTARELREMLADCDCRIAVCDPAAAQTLQPFAAEVGVAHLVLLDGADAERMARWASASGGPISLPDPDAVGMIQYTGGTTGRAKGVVLRHRAIATNVAQREALLPTVEGDRILCMMPLFHSFALAMNLYQALHCAGTMVILPRYRPDWVVAALAAERITVLPAGASVFTGLLGYAGFAEADLSHLRICYSGASALPAEVLRRWEDATGAGIFEGYGQTEAGPILTYNSPLFPVKPAKVGRALPLTEIEIVDPDTPGEPLPTGASGEIRVRGPQLMDGYWRRPEETAAALRDGWLHTGDIGSLDAEGYLAILDRKKDMVVTGGYNVYPREVDDVLLAHPAIHEAASFGIADDYRGEILGAHVVLRPGQEATAESLIEHCRANLAKYKVPATLVLVEEIPKTGVGKIDRKALRALYGG